LTPSEVNMKIGTDATFTCIVTSTLNTNVTWYKKTGSTETAITAIKDKLQFDQTNFTIKNVSISDEGSYFCKATNDVGESESSSVLKLAVYSKSFIVY